MSDLLDKILETKPIECTDSSVEVHVLTCKRDVMMMFWNIKSFYHFNNIHYKLIVHTDGTVDDLDKINIKRHFIGSHIIDPNEADTLISNRLVDYPYCKQLRDTYKKQPFILKIFDPFFFCSSEYYLVLDADLLFFTPTTKVISYINEKTPFYFGGHWGYLRYPVSIQYLHRKKFKPVGNLNAGILGIPNTSKFFNLDFIERYVKIIKEAPKRFLTQDGTPLLNIDLIGAVYTGDEEPLYSVLMGESEHKVLWCGEIPYDAPSYCMEGPDKIYGIGDINSNLSLRTMLHYVEGDKSRKIGAFLRGIDYLIQNSFLEKM